MPLRVAAPRPAFFSEPAFPPSPSPSHALDSWDSLAELPAAHLTTTTTPAPPQQLSSRSSSAAKMVPSITPSLAPSASTPTSAPLARSGSASASATRVGQPGGPPVPPCSALPTAELNALFPGPDSKDAESRARGVVSSGNGADGRMLLELADGTAYEGYAFGSDASISGECVFQTGE